MAEFIDSELLGVLRELTGDDQEFLEELITAYMANLEEFRVEASQAVEARDLVVLKEHLHKIYPTLLTIRYHEEYQSLVNMKERLNAETESANLELIRTVCERAILQLERIQELS